MNTRSSLKTPVSSSKHCDKSKIAKASLFVIHLLAASFILSLLYSNFSKRHTEFQTVENAAIEAKSKMEQRTKEVQIHKSLLNGLQDNDPYVIEKLAREKHGYAGYNELSPPRP